ncbi:MAG: NADH-quinone oxidoreductase subunit NuoF [Caulobacter sp.]|nr:NADH-quinone oxidoreductase subunit NuoF [Caulobacter sp.]
MVGILEDKDRIFTNLYGLHDWGLEGAKTRGCWNATKDMLDAGPAWIIDNIKNSGLRGRGGAGFGTGLKWSFMPKEVKDGRPHYLVVNADESEPGTCKDREIMRHDPHLLIEGCLIASRAMQAHACYIYIRGEYVREREVLEAAIKQAYDAKLIGKNNVHGWDFDCYVHHGAGAYICGEETALLESIEGKKGQPRFKPPFPASFGLYGKPTTINNTETLASVPWIVQHGGQAFLELGKPNNGGPKLFSVSGHVNKPGNYEVPLGMPFSELLEMAGGVRNGHQLKAVIPGGSSAPVLPADIVMDCTMDFDSIAKAGSMLGSGAVIVMDETVCMVRALERLSYFYFEESCGQCTPCREGTGWMYRIIHRIEHGEGRPEDLELLNSVAGKIGGHTICALGDAAAMPVQSFLKHFGDEFAYHVEHRKCMV